MSATTRITKASQARHFVRQGFDGSVYIEKEAAMGFTALEIRVDGSHPVKRLTGNTTRIYYVADGGGTFWLDGEIHEVSQGDVITILPEGTYSYEGQMRLFELNVSPTNTFTDSLLA